MLSLLPLSPISSKAKFIVYWTGDRQTASKSTNMDFASLMSKELSKSSGGNSAKKDNSNKFLKRSEIEAQRESNYISEQKALAKERDTKAAAKRKLEEDTIADNKLREERRRKLAEESKRRREDQEWEEEQARRKRLGLPERERPNPDAEDDKDKIPPNEDIEEEDLRLKLRELGHAAILFGESHAARLRRYKKLTTVLTTGPIPTTLKLVEEKDMKVETVPQDKDGREFLFRQLASYFTMVLIAYEKAMDGSRTSTTEGKAAYAAMVQARENMRPVCNFPTLQV